MKKASYLKSDQPISKPKKYVSPADKLAQADTKGGSGIPELPNTTNEVEVELIPSEDTVRPRQLLQQLSNPEIERMKQEHVALQEENKRIMAELVEFKNAIMLPQLQEKFTGNVVKVADYFYLVERVDSIDRALCTIIGPHFFSSQEIDFNKVTSEGTIVTRYSEYVKVLNELSKQITTLINNSKPKK